MLLRKVFIYQLNYDLLADVKFLINDLLYKHILIVKLYYYYPFSMQKKLNML